MELVQLEYFVETARQGNITRAAEALHISQPALSLAIKRLENELGTELFDRIQKRIVLNDAGREFLDGVIPVLTELNDLTARFKNRSDTHKKNISVNLRAATKVFIGCIVDYRAAHPDAVFRLSHSHENTDPRTELDIFTLKPTEQIGPDSFVIFEEPVYLAVPCSSVLAALDEIDLKDIAHEPLMMQGQREPNRPVHDQYCRAAGFEPVISMEIEQISTLRSLADSGMGICFWPATWGAINESNAHLLRIRTPVCKRQVVLRYLPGFSPKSPAESFARFLQDYDYGKFFDMTEMLD